MGIATAIASYFALHAYAKPDPALVMASGQIAGFTVQALSKGVAFAAQYLIPLLCFAGTVLSVWNRKRRDKLIGNVTASNSVSALDALSWQEFEVLVGRSFTLQGYMVAEVGEGADGGIDLVLHRGSQSFLVQCKQWKALKLVVDVVRERYGVMAAKGAAGG